MLNIDRLVYISLLVIVILYFSQGIVILSPTVGQILLALIYVISISYLIRMTMSTQKFHRIMKPLILFMLMIFFGYLFSDNYAEYNILKSALLNFLPFFPFYYFAKKDLLTSKDIGYVFFVLLLLFIIKFQTTAENLMLEKFNDDILVNNTSYLFIGLLSFVFFIKNRIIAICSLIVICLFIVQSLKRGPFLAGTLSLILFVIQMFYKSHVRLNKLYGLLLLVFILGFIIFEFKFLIENEFLVTRLNEMLEGESSGRNYIALKAFQKWYYLGNFSTYLFGQGYNSVKNITGHFSHNDWLDMLVSYGFFGLFLYLCIYIVLFLEILSKGWNAEKKIILIQFFLIAILTSLTSRWYWSNFAFTQMIILPYLFVTKNKPI